jgi:epoxyqueuosine reductase
MHLEGRFDRIIFRAYFINCKISSRNSKVSIMSMDAHSLTIALKEKARLLGFDLVGATQAVTPPEIEHLEKWLANGLDGEMRCFSRRMDAYREPGLILHGVKSILMLGVNYRTAEPASAGPGQGKVSRYAWGGDYHDVIRRRLRELADFHRRLVPHCGIRGVVDTAPLLERAFARRAGFGWIGKNTLLVNERFGSWIFLAALLTTEKLQFDEPGRTEFHSVPDGLQIRPTNGLQIRPTSNLFPDQSRCGACRACLDACPTGALEAPYRLDARKCISYLTIESRGPIPPELRQACGDRLFGCDACQEACPWNHGTPTSSEKTFQPQEGMNPVRLAELSALDEVGFRRRFRNTPLWRIKLDGLLRNAAMVLENQRHYCE